MATAAIDPSRDADLLESIGAYNLFTSTLRTDDRVDRVLMSIPSLGLFAALGVQPELGRLPGPDDGGGVRPPRVPAAGAGRYDYTLASRIDDLDALLRHLRIDGPVTLAVHDWGGMVGFGWALRDPELSAPEVRYLIDFIRSSRRGVILRRPTRRAEELVADE